MRKIYFQFLILCAALMFASCGANNNDYDDEAYENADNYDVVGLSEQLDPTPTPREIPMPYIPAVYENENIFIFESGVLGVKFSINHPADWNFRVESRAGGDTTLLSHLQWDTVGENTDYTAFQIGTGTAHPSNWYWMFPNPGFPSTRTRWVQSDTPDEVFVTDNGITVVKYSYTSPRPTWEGEYPYAVEGYTDELFTTVLFMFRQDGQDYRDIEGTSIFFYTTLDTHVDLFYDFYEYARAIVNSLQFLDGTEIRNVPSETAESIGITANNFPRIDGSTSAIDLMNGIMHKMFVPSPYFTGDERQRAPWRYDRWHVSRTIPSYELLIAGEVDMVIVPEPSAFVRDLAEEAGVELEFTPIIREALVFITSSENPVSEITWQQVLQIYADASINNWAELGGLDGRIIPLNRNAHSGSQTLMENLVLGGREMHPSLDRYVIERMETMISSTGFTRWEIRSLPDWQFGDEVPNFNYFALGYTVYFFLASRDYVKPLAFDGVFPSYETITSGEYPLITHYYAVIRADTPDNSPERKIIDWLLTPEGQDIVSSAFRRYVVN